MSSQTEVKDAPFVPDFGDTGALRQIVGETGRIHLDRWLPFLFLHRGPDDGESLARRIATNGPAYCLWSEGDDAAACDALAAVLAKLVDHEGKLLVVTLADGPLLPHHSGSNHLPSFEAIIGAAEKGDADRAARALERALNKVAVDLRLCTVDRVSFEPLLPPKVDEMLNGISGVERLTLTVPQIHRTAGGSVFPEIRHELVMQIGDGLLRSACAFIDDGEKTPPPHYRALGRSAYLAAALKAD
ncbi:MAG: hypothetical protein ABIR63_07680, partial [Sphingomicrobium sp.]